MQQVADLDDSAGGLESPELGPSDRLLTLLRKHLDEVYDLATYLVPTPEQAVEATTLAFLGLSGDLAALARDPQARIKILGKTMEACAQVQTRKNAPTISTVSSVDEAFKGKLLGEVSQMDLSLIEPEYIRRGIRHLPESLRAAFLYKALFGLGERAIGVAFKVEERVLRERIAGAYDLLGQMLATLRNVPDSPSNKCASVRPFLPTHREGRLEEKDAEMVRTHLRICASCMGHLRCLTDLQSVLEKLCENRSKSPSDLVERIVQEKAELARPSSAFVLAEWVSENRTLIVVGLLVLGTLLSIPSMISAISTGVARTANEQAGQVEAGGKGTEALMGLVDSDAGGLWVEVVEVKKLAGTVEVRPPRGTAWRPAGPGLARDLAFGMHIRTAGEGQLHIHHPEGLRVRLQGDAEMMIHEQGYQVVRGTIAVQRRGLQGAPVVFLAGKARVTALSGSSFRVQIDEEAGYNVTLLDGNVEVLHPKDSGGTQYQARKTLRIREDGSLMSAQ